MSAGRWQEALRIAARFPDLGPWRGAILDAHTAYTNPRWSAALGQDAEQIKAAGRAALLARYS